MTTRAESIGLRNPDHIVFSEYVPAIKTVRVPCNLIGKLLDHGKASAHALKLLAIKVSKGDGFVLNEVYVRDRYKVKTKAFRAGIALLKKTGVLDRTQPNRRTYAKETLAKKAGSFVIIDENLLEQDKAASLVAFVMTVKISPEPGLPVDFAKRIGVTARGTGQRLAKQAVQHGCDILVGTGVQPMLVGRGGSNFELFKKELSKKELSKKEPTHSRREKGTDSESTPQNLKASAYATRNPGGFSGMAAEGDLKERQIVLSSWKRSAFWRDRDLLADGQIDIDKFSIDSWRWNLRAYGGAPEHMGTMHSFRQAVEVAHELAACMEGGADDKSFIMQALAYWTSKAHADGRPIRSLGFIAEPLARQCDTEDYEWCFSYPSRLPDATYAHVLNFAEKAVDWAESRGLSTIESKLLSTQGIEDLSGHFDEYGQTEFVEAANMMISNEEKPSEGCSIIRWSWFAKYAKAQPKRGRGRR